MLLDEYVSGNKFEPLNQIVEQLNNEIVREISENQKENSLMYLLKSGLILKLTIEKDEFKNIYRFEIVNKENVIIEKISFHFWNPNVAIDHDLTVTHKFYDFLDDEVLYSDYNYKFKNGEFVEENSFALRYGIDYDRYNKVKYDDRYYRTKEFINNGTKYDCKLVDISALEFVTLKEKGFQKVKGRR